MFSFLEETPLDIAATYGDYYLYGFIKEKWEALPPVKDKRKMRAKKTSARPRSTPASAQVEKNYKSFQASFSSFSTISFCLGKLPNYTNKVYSNFSLADHNSIINSFI